MPEHLTLGGQQALDGMPPDPVPTTSHTPGSIVARLRAQAQAQTKARQQDIMVGGSFQNLFIRYKPLAPADMDKFVASRQGARIQDISATAATMDMMARACVCVVGKYEGEEEVLADDDGPVKLDYRLGALLGMPFPDGSKPTSHEVIAMLFGNNGAMIAMHGENLASWMQDPTMQEDQLVGES